MMCRSADGALGNGAEVVVLWQAVDTFTGGTGSQKFFSTLRADLPRRYWSQYSVNVMYQDTSDISNRIPRIVYETEVP